MTKKRWEKKGDKFFSRNTHISQAKNDGKNRLDKVRKYVFYKHTNIVTKKWEKIARKFFFQKQRISRPKNDGKNRLEKCKKRFL